MTCPDCKGEKKIGGYACPGFRYIEIPCPRCKATGDISEEQAELMRKGKLMREARVKAKRSLSEQAKILGMSPSAYSDLEMGRGRA